MPHLSAFLPSPEKDERSIRRRLCPQRKIPRHLPPRLLHARTPESHGSPETQRLLRISYSGNTDRMHDPFMHPVFWRARHQQKSQGTPSPQRRKFQGTLYFKKASIKESSYKETVQPRRSANLENKQTSLRSWNLFIKINEYYTPILETAPLSPFGHFPP